jgi:hypothetical protein
MTPQQIQALRAVAMVFIDAVKAAGPGGAPAGVMFAACIGKLTLSQFEQITAGLVNAGKLRKQGNLFFAD